MLDFHLKMHSPLRKEVLSALQSAQLRGDVSLVKRLLAVLALASGQSDLQVASFLQVRLESVHRWKVSLALQPDNIPRFPNSSSNSCHPTILTPSY